MAPTVWLRHLEPLVGSIGAISVRPVLAEAFRKMGVDVSVTKAGDLKDMGAIWASPYRG